MNFYDYCLKFENADEMSAVLRSLGFNSEENQFSKEGTAIDIIGTITEPSETKFQIVNDEKVPVQVQLPGYHVNIRSNEALFFEPKYIVTPSRPVRVWA